MPGTIILRCGWLALCIACGMVSLGASSAQAGCRLHGPSQPQTVRVTIGQGVEGNPWYSGPARVLYSGGKLKYFAVPRAGEPCNGPQCGRSTPETSLAPQAVVESQRSLEFGRDLARPIFEPSLPGAVAVVQIAIYCEPELSGLLRPPRAA